MGLVSWACRVLSAIILTAVSVFASMFTVQVIRSDDAADDGDDSHEYELPHDVENGQASMIFKLQG